MIARLSIGLTLRHLILVALMFIATFTGALILAWWFRRQNRKAAA